MKNHSMLPWEVVEANEHHGAYIVPAYGGDVCDLYAMSNPTAASVRNGGNSHPVHFDNSAENAKLIVKAVNAHDALVAALQDIVDGYGPNHGSQYCRNMARAALARCASQVEQP
jgi:hypothetical protein